MLTSLYNKYLSVMAWNRWAVQEDIIYLRAVKYVPREMKTRLPAQLSQRLDHTKVSGF